VTESILRRGTGSALAVKNWAWQLTHPNETLPGEVPYANQDRLVESVKESLEAGMKIAGKAPKILVIGAVSLAQTLRKRYTY
jgi:hypothetical protein